MHAFGEEMCVVYPIMSQRSTNIQSIQAKYTYGAVCCSSNETCSIKLAECTERSIDMYC